MGAESKRVHGSEVVRPPRTRTAARGGCCAARQTPRAPGNSGTREHRPTKPVADVTAANETSQVEPLGMPVLAESRGPAELSGADRPVQSLAESNERRSAVLLSATVTGSECMLTDETRWVGGDRATAMHYRIQGTMRHSDGSECAFASWCRYSLLHELHERMSHDRLGAHTTEEREQLRRGLALFPGKKWIGGDSLVASRELDLSRWLEYWATLAGSIGHTGDKVKILHSGLARCSALICEYLAQNAEQCHRVGQRSSPPETSDALGEPSREVAPRVARQLFDRDGAAASSALGHTGTEPTREGGSAQPTSVALRVRIGGVRSPVGAIRLVVWNSSDAWLDDDRKCCHHRCVLSPSESAEEVFETTLPPLPVLGESGTPIEYAMMAIHDIRDTGKLDTNEIGIPRDGICCTNGATGGAQGPKWSAAKFHLVSISRDVASSDCIHCCLTSLAYSFVLVTVGGG